MKSLMTALMTVLFLALAETFAGAAVMPLGEFLVPESSGSTTANSGTEGPATGSLGSGVSFSGSEPMNGIYATGSSLSFDGGANSRVTVGGFPSLQSDFNQLTVMAWVNIPDFDSVTLRHVVHLSSASGGLPTGFAFTVGSSGQLGFTYRQDDGAIPTPVSDNGAVTIGEWTHIALTADFPNGVLTYYVNGSVYGGTDALDSSRSIEADGSTLLALGRLAGVDASMMKGGLDDVRIYNAVLSVDEIHDAMTIPEPGTVALALVIGGLAVIRRPRIELKGASN